MRLGTTETVTRFDVRLIGTAIFNNCVPAVIVIVISSYSVFVRQQDIRNVCVGNVWCRAQNVDPRDAKVSLSSLWKLSQVITMIRILPRVISRYFNVQGSSWWDVVELIQFYWRRSSNAGLWAFRDSNSSVVCNNGRCLIFFLGTLVLYLALRSELAGLPAIA
jgi:hypothetical protein